MQRSEPLQGHERYEKVKDLSEGNFGFVQLARDKVTGEHVAIKFLERGPGDTQVNQYVKTEVLNHRSLDHPHVVQFREVFLTPHYLGIAMEYANAGDLDDYLKQRRRLREEEARWIFHRLVSGLHYCHRQGVVNRDLKLKNTLLSKDEATGVLSRVQICDFGMSKLPGAWGQSAPNTRLGSPMFVAPEVIRLGQGETYDGAKVDIWACGVMLYRMVVGAFPFEPPPARPNTPNAQRLQDLMDVIIKCRYWVPPQLGLSFECKDIIGRILVADPRERITLDGIIYHPWFTQGLPPGLFDGGGSGGQQEQQQQQQQSRQQQPREEIEAIIEEARKDLRSQQQLLDEAFHQDDSYNFEEDY